MFNLNMQDNWYFCIWLYLNVKPYTISYSKTEENVIANKEVPQTRQSVLTWGQKEKEKNQTLQKVDKKTNWQYWKC